MAFPELISQSDYLTIRLVLGLASSDTTNLPDATIESRLFGPYVERRVQQGLTDWATILTGNDACEEQLKDAVCLWIASRIAGTYLARRASEEVAEAALGPQRVKWRAPVEWTTLAESLAAEAAAGLAAVAACSHATDVAPRVQLAEATGPTRNAIADDEYLTEAYWLDLMQPAVVKGHV